MLKKLGMSVSPDKTQRAAVEQGFEFLGIKLTNGFIRPCKKAQERVLASMEATLMESREAFRQQRKTGKLTNGLSLLESLGKVRGVMQGWGKHYRFCNDSKYFENLDKCGLTFIRDYLAVYREERDKMEDAGRWRLLGIEALARLSANHCLAEKETVIVTSRPKLPRKPGATGAIPLHGGVVWWLTYALDSSPGHLKGHHERMNNGNPFFDHPILNSPYSYPERHWELDDQGQPTQKIIEHRRPAEFITPIPKPKKRKGSRSNSPWCLTKA